MAAYHSSVAVRDVRTMLITGGAILLLAAAWAIYVVTRPPEVTSGGGTASQYALSSAGRQGSPEASGGTAHP